MLRFATTPDIVFQAILRDSIGFVVDDIDALLRNHQRDDSLAKEEFKNAYQLIGKVFTPSLALDSLKSLLECLDRPELYQLNGYHYMLLYTSLEFFIEVHNDMLETTRSEEEKKKLSFIDPFYIEYLDFIGLVELYFPDTDFLTTPEVMLNLPPEHKEMFESEIFPISQGLLAHPEELKLRVCDIEDPSVYVIKASEFFGPGSSTYPDYEYYEKNHPEQLP